METFTCKFQVTTLILEICGSVFIKYTVICDAFYFFVVKSKTSGLSYYETLFLVHVPKMLSYLDSFKSAIQVNTVNMRHSICKHSFVSILYSKWPICYTFATHGSRRYRN